MQGITKRQHYVPQFVLRNFSRDGATTSLMVLGSSKRVETAPINRQCYEPYFYGSDQVMERSFAAEEDKIAALLGDMSHPRLAGFSGDDLKALRTFAHYQRARTRGAAEHLSNFAAEFVKSTVRGTMQLNHVQDLRPENIDLVDIRLKDAQNESIWQAAKSLPATLDLAVKFITTERTRGFVISDHPVAAYNQFAEHHPRLRHYPTATGLVLKGLQLFMPLSPSVTLAVYDPGTYEYGGKSLVCRAGPSDTQLLNRIQAISAWECFFYDKQRADEGMLDDLCRARSGHAPIYKKAVSESRMLENEDGTMRRFVAVAHAEIRLGAKLSFIRPIDGHAYDDYEGPAVPVRSHQLMTLLEMYGKRLEDEVARRKSAGES